MTDPAPARLAVGLLHFTAPPVVGGVESVLGQHARLLSAAGHRVRVIAGRGGPLDGGAAFVRVPLADGMHPAVREVQRALDMGEVPSAYEALVDRLVADLGRAVAGLDLVVAHNVCCLCVNVPLTDALRRSSDSGAVRRLLAWDHDVAAAMAGYAGRLHPGRPWDLFREAWPGVPMVTVSDARRAELAVATGVEPGAIHVVPNGIDRDRFLGLAPATRRLVDVLGLRSAGPILLTPARVTSRKNLELAIDVATELRRASDARLLLTGAPDPHDVAARRYLDALRTRAANAGGGVHVLADGPSAWRADRVVADLFRIADALFLPSRDEGFGLPILEAAVSRLPIACADIPALRELAGGDAVYFDPADDPARVAALVRDLLARDAAGRLAFRTRTEYDWARVFETRIEPLLLASAAGLPGSTPRPPDVATR